MGHDISEWRNKVLGILRDATSEDVSAAQVDDVGLRPAINQYTLDRPRKVVTEVAGVGSPYLALPAGWVVGFSRLVSIEHPARQNPPRILDEQSWLIVSSPADAGVEQVLLDRTPVASEYVRFTFTAPWPFPTATAGDDKIDDVAYEAVARLAAAFCIDTLAAEAARDRMGAVPTDFAGGRDRTRQLGEVARAQRNVYDAHLRALRRPPSAPRSASLGIRTTVVSG